MTDKFIRKSCNQQGRKKIEGIGKHYKKAVHRRKKQKH